jgi:quercetin dioxygenase-like cupin family protein
MVEEARLEESEYGLTAATEGWFVVNVRDGAWMTNEALGAAFIVEGGDYEFPQLGYTLAVLSPGQASRYHREGNQENFLVLAGECIVLIEGEERPLKPWDFVHCPAGTDHAFVGAGDGRCVIFMTGAREGWPEKGIVYPRSELALKHGAGVETETTSPPEAYASFPKWKPGPPPDFTGLPWDR